MSPQAGWILKEEVVPRLRSAIPRSVHYIGSEDAEELVQDATCLAGRMLDNAERQGKQVTPGNIAYYTILHMKSGRRSTGNSNADVLGSATQLNGRSTTTSLDEPVEEMEGEVFTVNDVLSLDDEDPGEKAGRKLDWDAFLAKLSEREKAVVEGLLTGQTASEVARSLSVDPTTIRYFKQRLALKILDFMGADILREVVKRPGWRNCLHATRQRLACKNHRRN